MKDQYSEAAAALLRRVADRSRSTPPAHHPPAPAPTIRQLVINRPTHCTFILNGTAPPGVQTPPAEADKS